MYKIFLQHNRSWSSIELMIFLIISVFLIFILSVKIKKKRLLFSQAIAGMLLFFFMAVVLASTIFTRTSNNIREYCLIPFWSWWEAIQGNKELFKEILLNILLFGPVGFLLPFVLHKKVAKIKIFMLSFFAAMFIEICQLVFCVGFFEWDDMVHNAIGATVASVLANKIFEKFMCKSKEGF